jgi:hypothetical protein
MRRNPFFAPVKPHLTDLDAQKDSKIGPVPRKISPLIHVFSRDGSPKQ